MSHYCNQASKLDNKTIVLVIVFPLSNPSGQLFQAKETYLFEWGERQNFTLNGYRARTTVCIEFPKLFFFFVKIAFKN